MRVSEILRGVCLSSQTIESLGFSEHVMCTLAGEAGKIVAVIMAKKKRF